MSLVLRPLLHLELGHLEGCAPSQSLKIHVIAAWEQRALHNARSSKLHIEKTEEV